MPIASQPTKRTKVVARALELGLVLAGLATSRSTDLRAQIPDGCDDVLAAAAPRST